VRLRFQHLSFQPIYQAFAECFQLEMAYDDLTMTGKYPAELRCLEVVVTAQAINLPISQVIKGDTEDDCPPLNVQCPLLFEVSLKIEEVNPAI